MTSVNISRILPVKNQITPPADKSVSHRAIMLASIAEGKTTVKNFLNAEDCMCTLRAFESMGVSVTKNAGNELLVTGVGLRGLSKPRKEIYLGNSGTSMRLLLGILAGQEFETVLTGDDSLSKRPMKRVTQPLISMGAKIEGADNANFAPLKIKGGGLKAINYNLPMPSAQVKSCLMLAALYANGTSIITEPQKSRDHTERMFRLFKINCPLGSKISVTGNSKPISPGEIIIPADISSAAFFIALGVLLPDSQILIKSCGVNPTRTGFLDVLKRMGALIDITNVKAKDYEPYADIIAQTSKLKSTTIEAEEIPRMIDEIPIFALLAAFAQGETIIKGLSELRVKETDRINSIVTGLSSVGVDIKTKEDTIIVRGPSKLKPARVQSFGDHRTAMTLIIAGCLSEGETIVEDTDCIDTSFPAFVEIISGFKKR